LQIKHRQLGAITLTNRKAIGLLAYLLIESDHETAVNFCWLAGPTCRLLRAKQLRVTWRISEALGRALDAQPT